jgi:hypothetical protein
METNKATDRLKILELVKQNNDILPTNSSNTITLPEISEEKKTNQIVIETIDSKKDIFDNIENSNKLVGGGAITSKLSNTLPSSSAANINNNILTTNNKNQTIPGATSSASVINRLQVSEQSSENYSNMIKALDLCYIEDDINNSRFALINAINLCVTVISYATHANRANQMMIILDAIIPRYLEYLRSETEIVKNNSNLQKYIYFFL